MRVMFWQNKSAHTVTSQGLACPLGTQKSCSEIILIALMLDLRLGIVQVYSFGNGAVLCVL